MSSEQAGNMEAQASRLKPSRLASESLLSSQCSMEHHQLLLTQPGTRLMTSLWLGLQAVHKQGRSSPWPSLDWFPYQPISTCLRLTHLICFEPPPSAP